MTTEYANDDYCNMLSTLVLVLLQRNMYYIFLVDDIQSLMKSTSAAASPSDKNCNTYGTCEDRSPTDFAETSY